MIREDQVYNYMYVIIRGDLNMSPGKLSAQAGHAYTNTLVMCLEKYEYRINDYFKNKMMGNKVTLEAKDEIDLLIACEQCKKNNIPHALIIDEGHVMLPYFDGKPIITALGIGPVDKTEVKSITNKYKLLK